MFLRHRYHEEEELRMMRRLGAGGTEQKVSTLPPPDPWNVRCRLTQLPLHFSPMKGETTIQKKQPKSQIAVFLGYVVIFFSMVYKIPQIVQIQKARSARGVNFLTNMQDLMAYVFAFAYSYSEGIPFLRTRDFVPGNRDANNYFSDFLLRTETLPFICISIRSWNGRLQLCHVQSARSLWPLHRNSTFKSVEDNNYYFGHHRKTTASPFELSGTSRW